MGIGNIMGCIYCATNNVNGKQYVGKTGGNLAGRKKHHEGRARRGSGWIFHDAIREFGADAFSWELIFASDDDQALCQMEVTTINDLKTMAPTGYNLTEGGDGLPNPSKGTRAKMRTSRLKQLYAADGTCKVKFSKFKR